MQNSLIVILQGKARAEFLNRYSLILILQGKARAEFLNRYSALKSTCRIP